MSGLTVGLFSIDPMKLAVLKTDTTSSPIDKQRAEALGPVLKNHHRLLVTLLVINAAAMEAMPIFLDSLMPSYLAIIVSVTFVLFAGEIVPQAIVL
jgi:metal transporter CNNM